MNDILNTPEPDSLQRFLFEQAPIRGELVHLDVAWRSVIERHDYPEVLRNIMGELAAAAVLLAATLKLQGSLVLQIMGKGAVRLLVVECSGDMKLRATAKWSGDLAQGSFAELIGDGQFVITLDPKDGGQPYQGIVALEGSSVAEVMQNYMTHSEQLETRLWLAADGQQAAGMLLQKMPDAENQAVPVDQDAWPRAVILADTLKTEELLLLPAITLIQRLYHEEDIRLFDAQRVTFYCSCSRENVGRMLQMLGRDEVNSILAERENIEVHCEFCNQRYEFDKVDAEVIFVDAVVLPPSEARH
ncbi:MAG TPA: Hsp33 family molecular chaperone HslO [Gallionellaceae bacterium]|nr:Hsp33 family molecular chaperone HslO [Gallionellaceae bacterium]